MKYLSKKKRPVAEMNVVPYIDVMLVLLMIFMITAPMLTQGVTVDLPKASSQPVVQSDKEPIVVSVNKQGEYFLNISEAPDSPMTPDTIAIRVAAELALAKENHESLSVLVKGDAGVPYGKVVIAMAMLKKSGAKKVGLLTDSSEDTSQALEQST